MIINKEGRKIIDSYLDKLTEIERRGLIKGAEEIKEKISKRMASNICEKVYDVRQCCVPNEKDVQEKITYLMDKIIDRYYKEVHSYIVSQNQMVMNSLTINNDRNIELDNFTLVAGLSKQVPYVEINKDREIINEIITRVNSHISFRNQNNPEYYKKRSDIENYVREEVSKKMVKFKNEIEEMYDYILKSFDNERAYTLDYATGLEKKETYNNNQVSNQAGSLGPILDVDGLGKRETYNNNQVPNQAESLGPILDVDGLERKETYNNQVSNQAGSLEPILDVDEEYHTQELDKEVIKKKMQELRDSLVPEEENEKRFK